MDGRELRKRPNSNDVPTTSKKSRVVRDNENENSNLPSTSQSTNQPLNIQPINPLNSLENNNLNENGQRKGRKRFENPFGQVRDPLDLTDLTLRDTDLNRFFNTLKDVAVVNQVYDVLKYETAFQIKNIRNSKNPAGLLLYFFDESIQVAINAAVKYLKTPKLIAIKLYNKNLADDIIRPFREIENDINNGLNLLREFAKANQSARHGSLLDADTILTIIIKSENQGRGLKKLSNK